MRDAVRLACALLVAAGFASAQSTEPWTITESTTLERGATLHRPIVIGADDITIDGNGATLVGPGRDGDRESFRGVGISGTGRRGVVLENVTVRGFRVGLAITDGVDWTIEGCDVSGNYTDPSFGWGELPPSGGIRLVRTRDSRIRNTSGRHNFNACELVDSHGNRIEFCDFSRASNTCLKLWRSTRNRVERCNLSYGIRKLPGETHARDSTGVLLETGSNDNWFWRNDVTHGGDGIFIRALNTWLSTGNVFIENDTSHANNNGVESWSPGNIFVRNKANHCSYGFWLGGSDRTVLIGNEANHNGRPDGNHNAPESGFGHGGIVIVNGPGSHLILDGNVCRDNHGGGIVFRGHRASRGGRWRSHHLVIQRNTLIGNRWGIYGQFADWVDIAANTFDGNDVDVHLDACTNVFRRAGTAAADAAAPRVAVECDPPRVVVGEPVTLRARSESEGDSDGLAWRWDLDGATSTLATVVHTFDRVGFHRVGVTGTAGVLSSLAHVDLWVAPTSELAATESDASSWRGMPAALDDDVAVTGARSLRLRPDAFDGTRVAATLAIDPPVDARRVRGVAFFLRWRNPNKWSFTGPNPIVRLRAGDVERRYLPIIAGPVVARMLTPPNSESREGWLYCEVPLDGDDAWFARAARTDPTRPFASGRLHFDTIVTRLDGSRPTALGSDGKTLYCVVQATGVLHASTDGVTWRARRHPREDLGHAPDWMSGSLAFVPARRWFVLPLRGKARHLCAYDIDADRWLRLPTATWITHATVAVGDAVFGLAHAIGGNYGGPLCRVPLDGSVERDEHSVLDPIGGADAWWFSRAAQLARLDERVWAIKNDWKAPQPPGDAAGDRLLSFAPDDYAASTFAGEDRFDAAGWRERKTRCTDHGPLPFEIGHGASLVALPAGWGGIVGDRGGLFVVAGNSPADREGGGPPSDRWAIYDVASNAFTTGRLPGETGAGTSACLHDGAIWIKRAGTLDPELDRHLWRVTPLGDDPETHPTAAPTTLPFEKIDRLALTFDSWGYEPFTVWVDGLRWLER